MAYDFHRGTVRKLFATDLPLFRDHLLRLDAETRRNRFIGSVNDAFLLAYADQCFRKPGTLVFGYVEDGIVRGAAELHGMEAGSDATAEAAFSVEPALRNRGIGTALFGDLIRAARNRGVCHLRMNCLAHNAAMQALARKFQAQFQNDRWEIMAEVSPQEATPLTLIGEAASDLRAYAEAAFSLQKRIWAQPGTA